jgi:inosine/xanthosine triphosphatase
MPRGQEEMDVPTMAARAAERDTPLADVKRVWVGSVNGPKVEGVRQAFGAYLSQALVEGIDVMSGVAEQPVGYEEIGRGARNRARAALSRGGGGLAVGVEDGLVEVDVLDRAVLNVGCAAVYDGERFSLGLSAGFPYPPEVAGPALAGEPIGPLFDAFFARAGGGPAHEPSSLSVGNVGRLTLGALPRAEYTRHAVLCALVRFLHPDFYFTEEVR